VSTLVTVAEAKTHLRLAPDDTSLDADLTQKLNAAEAIVLDVLNLTPDMRTMTAAWDAATVPLPVKQAILLEVGELWRFRGDDTEVPERWTPDTGAIDLAPAILGLLRRVQPLVIG
jgi:hypothetical protein